MPNYGRIGRMRQRVTITPYTIGKDSAYGGPTATAGTPFDVWAEVTPVFSGENEYGGRLQGTAGFIVRTRYRSTIDQNATVTYDGVVLQVSGPPRVDPHKFYIELTCEQRKESAV